MEAVLLLPPTPWPVITGLERLSEFAIIRTVNTQQPPVQRYSQHVPQPDNNTLMCNLVVSPVWPHLCLSSHNWSANVSESQRTFKWICWDVESIGNMKPAKLDLLSEKRRKGAALMDRYLKINSWPYMFNTMKVSENWCESMFSQNMGWDRITKWKTICLPIRKHWQRSVWGSRFCALDSHDAGGWDEWEWFNMIYTTKGLYTIYQYTNNDEIGSLPPFATPKKKIQQTHRTYAYPLPFEDGLWTESFHLGCWRDMGYAARICSSHLRYSVFDQ